MQRVLVTGGSGLVGKALQQVVGHAGVVFVVRTSVGCVLHRGHCHRHGGVVCENARQHLGGGRLREVTATGNREYK